MSDPPCHPWRSARFPGDAVTDELEQLYQSTYTAVVRFLYRKVWDAERAEDLAQEVFVRALAHRPEKPRAWVFAVAANLARDEARAAVRRKRHLTLLKGDPIAQPAMTLAADDAVERIGLDRARAGGDGAMGWRLRRAVGGDVLGARSGVA